MCQFSSAGNPNCQKILWELKAVHDSILKINAAASAVKQLASPSMVEGGSAPHPQEGMSYLEKMLLISLQIPNADQRFYSIKRPLKNTCEWLFRHRVYDEWHYRRHAEARNSLMAIVGNPGSGKSTLIKEAYIRSQRERSHHVAAFFFDAKSDSSLRTAQALYQSLLVQLLPARRSDLREIAESHEDKLRPYIPGELRESPWTDGELKAMLRSIFDRPSSHHTVIYVDALDENHERRIREITGFLGELVESAHEVGAKLDICFSTRHFGAVKLRNCSSINVEENNRVDITTYLKH